MTHKYLYRVEDGCSQARFRADKGVLAGDVRSRVGFRLSRNNMRVSLGRHFCNHINWSNRQKTPLISVYDDYEAAYEEALRRKKQGKKSVVLVFIDLSRADRRLEYRNVRGLAKSLGCWIPHKAWNNSEFEYVFLHRIPACAIVKIVRL